MINDLMFLFFIFVLGIFVISIFILVTLIRINSNIDDLKKRINRLEPPFK